MSYDLYLSSPTLTENAFRDYFRGRPHYEEAGFYLNEDTGVYFLFEWTEAHDETDPEAPEFLTGKAHVAFNINYVRPHVFGLEAEPELTAFVRHFDCSIFDPQLEGMGEGQYTPDGFLQAWNAGNAFGTKAMAKDIDRDQLLIVDDSTIEAAWRWNHQPRKGEAGLEEDYFYPRLYFARRLNVKENIVFVVWGEGVSIVIPDIATHVLLMRMAPASGFAFFRKKQPATPKTQLVTLEQAAKFRGSEWVDGRHGRYLRAPAAPADNGELSSVVFTGPFGDDGKQLIRFNLDSVLDASLMT